MNASDMMPFGKYRNWPLIHIPPEYFHEIYRTKPDFMEKYPSIKLYIEQNHPIPKPEYNPIPDPALELKPLCPTNKHCFIDEEMALKVLKDITKRDQKHDKPIRAYQCEFCGYWHHTKKPLLEQKNSCDDTN